MYIMVKRKKKNQLVLRGGWNSPFPNDFFTYLVNLTKPFTIFFSLINPFNWSFTKNAINSVNNTVTKGKDELYSGVKNVKETVGDKMDDIHKTTHDINTKFKNFVDKKGNNDEHSNEHNNEKKLNGGYKKKRKTRRTRNKKKRRLKKNKKTKKKQTISKGR